MNAGLKCFVRVDLYIVSSIVFPANPGSGSAGNITIVPDCSQHLVNLPAVVLSQFVGLRHVSMLM